MKSVKCGFVGSYSVIDNKIKKIMEELLDINNKKLEQWYAEDFEEATNLTVVLANMLEPKPIITVLPKESIGDQIFKVDVIFTYPETTQEVIEQEVDGVEVTKTITIPEKHIAFQIKTNEGQAEVYANGYIGKSFLHKGQVYYYSGCWYIKGGVNLEALESLAKFTGTYPNPNIYKVLELLKTFKERKLTSKQGSTEYLSIRQYYRLAEPDVWSAMQTLELVSIAGDRIILTF